jgi:oligopeptide/dipeptide ABC transporter ATP-binding protein
MNEKNPIIKIEDLSVDFPVRGAFIFSKKKYIQAVTDVDLEIYSGETFGIVGESGCGKSTLANAMIGMVTPTKGKVIFKDKDLFALPRNEFKELRRDMQMIFQDPFSSLNPRFSVYQIISEPMLIRGGYTKKEMEDRVIELLKLVGLSEKDLDRYPSDFSGGQKQRIGIARAICLDPDFLICDEPVSALDVSVHAQILNLLIDLQDKLGMTYVFISHNLAVVKNVCQRILVMYLGKAMETGSTKAIYKNPKHPYTVALLSAILDLDIKRDKVILKGEIPSPIDPPKGCRFHQRCPKAMVGCKDVQPELLKVEEDHYVACHLYSGFTEEEKALGYDKPCAE